MQLDLFEHSGDVVLRNDAIQAARSKDTVALEIALPKLAGSVPNDPLLADLETLRRCLGARSARRLSQPEAAQAIQATEDVVAAARRIFGDEYVVWMAPLWVDLAAAVDHLHFNPADESVHAAALLLRAERWAQAAAAVATIPSWRRQPAPLGWQVEVEYRTAGIAAALPLLVELAWMDPARASGILSRLKEDVLDRLVRQFDHHVEGDGEPGDFCWFPAYVLIAEPRWARFIRLALAGVGSPAERCARQLLELQHIEREGRQAEIIAGRRKLRELHGRLFELYMKTR